MPKSKSIAPVVLYDRAHTPHRRLVAAGLIRRTGGRTVRITATPAGVAGYIRPAVTR